MRKNSNLGNYLCKAELSPEQLAREINRRHGVGTVSAKAPYGWLKGSFPRGRVSNFVVEVLSERLTTRIDVDQVWPLRVISVADDHDLLDQLEIPWNSEAIGGAARSHLDHKKGCSVKPLAPLPGVALVSAGVDWLTAEPRCVEARSVGEGVTSEVVTALNRRVAELRQFDDAQGGQMVARWSLHDLRWTLRLASAGSYDAAVGRRLHSVLAELAQLVGWLLIDLGHRGEGQQYLLAALREAARIGDHRFGAYILSCLSYDLTWHGDARDALRMLRIARMGARGCATGAVGAVLATRMARAHAQLGEDTECRTALMEATELVSTSGAVAAPDWCRWVTPAVLVADAGRAYLDLGRPDRAEERLTAGLKNFDRQQRRNRLLHHTSVAEARLALGQVDGAAEAVHTALELTESVESGRARVRLESLMGNFAGYDTAAAHEAGDHIRQALVRTPLSA